MDKQDETDFEREAEIMVDAGIWRSGKQPFELRQLQREIADYLCHSDDKCVEEANHVIKLTLRQVLEMLLSPSTRLDIIEQIRRVNDG